MKKTSLLLLILVLAVGCTAIEDLHTPQLELEESVVEASALPLPAVPAQPNPFSLEALQARSYGEGEITIVKKWEVLQDFTRYYITYPSDGLTIHGFVNIPNGQGPFPVVIALHGYIPASEYTTRDYSTRYADSIASRGYIVLHPNLRNFPPSDSVPRTRDYHSGYVIDVLNLLELVRKEASQTSRESIFQNADFARIGVWGHSLGGGVALRLAGMLPEIKAVVLYAAVTQRYTNASAGFTVFNLPASQAAFSLHHGEQDDTVAPSGTRVLYEQLQQMEKQVEYFSYPEQPHTFYRLGEADPLFIRRANDFFDLHLKAQ